MLSILTKELRLGNKSDKIWKVKTTESQFIDEFFVFEENIKILSKLLRADKCFLQNDITKMNIKKYLVLLHIKFIHTGKGVK